MGTTELTLETLLFEIRNNVARITLNRPHAANTLDAQMATDFLAIADVCEGNPDVRAILIAATGDMFCAGGDLKSFQAFGDKITDGIGELLDSFHAALVRFVAMDAPIITAVNGIAAGGGLAFVTMADYVLAGEDKASFVSAFTAAGLSPDSGSTYYLPRLIGLRRAQELLITNRRLNAAEAAEWGLITRTVPDANLMEEAEAIAAKIASGATKAIGGAKKLLLESSRNSIQEQTDLERATFQQVTKTQDSREGINAFIEKRKPSFTGS